MELMSDSNPPWASLRNFCCLEDLSRKANEKVRITLLHPTKTLEPKYYTPVVNSPG